MLIRDVMVTRVIAFRPDETIREATKTLAEHDIGGAPVVDGEGRLLGMVNEEDILRELRTRNKRLMMVFPSSHALGMTFEESITYKEVRDAFNEVGDLPVSHVMHQDFLAVKPDDLLEEVAPKMSKHGFNRVAVVEDGKLVGLLTRRDVINGLVGLHRERAG